MSQASAFFALTPDRVLSAVEIGGLRCTGRCLPVRAFENRVYEVELEDARRLIVKFYRPGRWSRATILDEHRFLTDLAAAELPVVPPMDLGTGELLPELDGISYAAFPRVRGRTLDEGEDERLRQVGRLIGRMHAVGAARDAPHRPRFTVDFYVRQPLAAILGGKFIAEPLAGRYRDLALRLADIVEPRLAAARTQRIHGDLHWGNTIWGADGPILLDFDDCCVGPPVQDLWLLARGDEAEVTHRREQLIAGYELFREFDRSTLALCEPLRALRIIHMSGWIATRWQDPSFQSGFPAFGRDNYWLAEYEALFRIFEGLGSP
ncbi:MAG: serine/threonine protein kinase [Candidatus Rokubacteria bacterium]|nr:serine/threonine protein kinase [Candidatus Rokubacteria bacterium]